MKQRIHRFLLLLILTPITVMNLTAQVGERGSMHTENDEEHPVLLGCDYEKTQEQIFKEEPDYYKKLKQFKIQNSNLQKGKIRLKSSDELRTIPIVVHILHNGDPLGSDQNPTDKQIASDIQKASDRFRHMHAGAGTYTNPHYGADTNIEFCLATVDESGNYTSGIVRHYEPIHHNNPDPNYVRDNIVWDQSEYSNMIIAHDISGACGRYRGGSYDYTEYLASCWWDGLIAHEMGHYFSLAHVFVGCDNDDCTMDNDGVCDTPPKNFSGTGGAACDAPGNACDTDDDDTSANNPYRPIANGGMGDQPDMLANYMDYTGGCWDSFTEGQKDKMCLFIDNNRSTLVNNQSVACAAPGNVNNDIGVFGITVNQNDKCDGSLVTAVNVYNYGTNSITSFTLDYYLEGNLIHTQNETITISANANVLINTNTTLNIPNGVFQLLEVRTQNPNGMTDINSNNDSDYRRVEYYADTECHTMCQDFHPMTASQVSTVVQVPGPFASPISNVTLCVIVEGDISSALERFEIFDEDGTLLDTTVTHRDCTGPAPAQCFIISTSDFNNWATDGTITITLTPISEEIRPNLCGTDEACIEIFIPVEGTDCPPNYAGVNKLTGIQNMMSMYMTDGILESDQIIDAQVDYKSGDYIEFLKNFEVKSGKQLQAYLDGCNNGQ